MTSKQPTPISAYAISHRIGRTQRAVHKAIHRLKLTPVLVVAGGSYYHPDVVDAIRAAMRKPNRTKEA